MVESQGRDAVVKPVEGQLQIFVGDGDRAGFGVRPVRRVVARVWGGATPATLRKWVRLAN
jgi:hypothetical protein